MATTQNEHNGNGTLRRFSFTFPYVKEDDVKVSLRTSTADVNVIASTNYTFPSATEIQFSAVTETDFQESTGAPKTGVTVRVFRDTDIDTERVTFFPGSSIRAQDLNDNTLQNLYASQERQNRAVDSTGGAMTGDLAMNNANIVFEGATADDFETTLTVTDPTADRTITLPNQTGTVPVLAAASNTQITATPEELNTLDGITATVAELNIMDGVTATAAELNTMDGITATTAELNTMDGITATVAELNTLDGITSTVAELNLLDGVTSTTAELNILDGVTATAAEINTLDGVTASTAELNLMDGVTATTAELNLLDGVTATTNELNVVDGVTATTAELNTLDGVTSTAAELNLLDGVTSTTAELNILDGVTATATELNTLDGVNSTLTAADLNQLDSNTLVTNPTWTSDTQFPSANAIDARITARIDPIGGYEAIADEDSFPATIPPVGTIISIANAGGMAIPANGTTTDATRAGGTDTVTITDFPTAYRGETLEDNIGLLVVKDSDDDAHSYEFHRALLSNDQVLTATNELNDFRNRYRVDDEAPTTSLDEGDLWWNTANDQLEVYDGNDWAAVTASGEFIRLVLRDLDGTAPTFDGNVREYLLVQEDDTSVNGSITTAQQLLLSVDGVMQRPNDGTTIDTTDNGFCRVNSNRIQLAGAPEENAVVFAIQMGTATQVNTPAQDSVDSEHYVDDSIDSQHLNSTNGSEAVTNDVIRDDAVTADKLADSADTDADRAVTRNHIRDDAIDGSKLADDACDSEHYTDGSIDQVHISNEAINEARLQVSNAPTNGQFLQCQSGNTGGLTWAEVPAPATADTDLFDADGTETDFTIESGRTVHNILVFVNGLLMRPTFGGTTRDYTVANTTLTFTTAPADGDEIDVRYLPA